MRLSSFLRKVYYMSMKIKQAWSELFSFLATINVAWMARISLFLMYFWFGAVKLFGLSQATPLAQALTTNTIGAQYFAASFMLLAAVECIIGIMFLFPKLTRVTVLIAFVHMVIVCSPLVLVPSMTWQAFLIPTIEGQYIIKNLALVTLMLVVLRPLQKKISK